MFNSLMKLYDIYTPTIGKNNYNEKIINYSKTNEIVMYISLLNHNNLNINDVNIIDSTHIGITFQNKLNIGDKINNKYIVKYIQPTGKDYIVTLKLNVGDDDE